MAGLTGLSGIAGYQVQINNDAQATPEQRSGGTVNDKHSERGETAKPYPWQSNSTQAATEHGPYGPQNQLLGDEQWFLEPAGMPWQDPAMDLTPSRRAAPWPKGIASGPVPGETPDQISDQLQQSRWIHGVNTHAGLRVLTGYEATNDTWERIDQTDTGFTDLRPLDRQALSSGFQWGTRDVVQSMARQNEYGFDAAHKMRRWATGGIPGNNYWMRPGGRVLAKSLPGPARPAIGPDSPFAGDDLGQSFDINGALLQNVPSEYTPPPAVNLAPAMVSAENDSVVEWY